MGLAIRANTVAANTLMALTREQAIETLCQKVEEVLHNNDWPTEEGQQSESGEPSPIDELITLIRHKKEGPWT